MHVTIDKDFEQTDGFWQPILSTILGKDRQQFSTPSRKNLT